jgi:hypothetical protein
LRCIADITCETDQPYWIKRDDFLQYVDRVDLFRRETRELKAAYLSRWFHRTPDGTLSFTLPAFYLEKGYALFINGRHRTSLLFRYLDLIPMSLAEIDNESHSTLARIVSRELQPGEPFNLPDLPFCKVIHRGVA